MEDPAGKFLPAIPEQLTRGVDELNFAEFPICIFSSNPAHVAESGKTLEFHDEIADPENPGQTLNRTVTVTGTDKYGLPTVIDDWVLLGLFQLAKLQKFPKKLHFTRYHLLKLLGWGTNARDYNKLTDCLRRIQGVQFTFEKAWWDGKARSWVSRTFNLYQDLEVYEAENSTTRPKPEASQASFSFVCSSFEWSEFLHSNFMNKAVRRLNFHFVKSLKKPTSKRLFRFLQKRLYNKPMLECDLHEFAEDHIGLRKGQKVGDIKRTLLSAIIELETIGYLQTMSHEERFPKVKRGRYRIVFKKGDFDPNKYECDLEQAEHSENPNGQRLAKSLIARGVSEKEAQRLSVGYPDTSLTFQLDIFDWEVQQGKKMPNPGGYLRTRITENYAAPKGFVSRAERERINREKKEKAKAHERKQRAKEETEKAAALAETERLSGYWNSLTEQDAEKAHEEALKRASRIEQDWIKNGGLIGDAAIKNLRDAYAREMLEEE